MDKFTKANGVREKNMEAGYGKAHLDRVIQESGKMVRCRALAFIFLKTVIGTKANLKTPKSKDQVPKDIIMVKLMSDSTGKIDRMAKDSIFGRMEIIIKVNL